MSKWNTPAFKVGRDGGATMSIGTFQFGMNFRPINFGIFFSKKSAQNMSSGFEGGEANLKICGKSIEMVLDFRYKMYYLENILHERLLFGKGPFK